MTVSDKGAATHWQDSDTDSEKTAKEESAIDDSATTIYQKWRDNDTGSDRTSTRQEWDSDNITQRGWDLVIV